MLINRITKPFISVQTACEYGASPCGKRTNLTKLNRIKLKVVLSTAL